MKPTISNKQFTILTDKIDFVAYTIISLLAEHISLDIIYTLNYQIKYGWYNEFMEQVDECIEKYPIFQTIYDGRVYQLVDQISESINSYYTFR